MREDESHSRGYLPHFVRPGALYFVTFRLADSLPHEVLVALEDELKTLQIRSKESKESITRRLGNLRYMETAHNANQDCALCVSVVNLPDRRPLFRLRNLPSRLRLTGKEI